MPAEVKLTEKYERNGWPAVRRPDLKPPQGWSLELLTAVDLIHHHSLSPDGRFLAFNMQRNGRTNVYTMPAAGGWPAPLTIDRPPTVYWMDSPPQWSPDGRFLAFTMRGHVYVVPADGRALPRRITDFTTSAWAPVWLPDSHHLIVTADRHDAMNLLLTDKDGGWPRAITNSGAGENMGAQPSPDGRFICYVHYPHDDLNRLDLRLFDRQTGETRTLSGAPKQKAWMPRWSPDGNIIAFLSQASGYNEIWAMQPDGRNRQQLTALRLEIGEFAWSPNGRHLAATVNRQGRMHLGLVDITDGALTDLRTGDAVFSGLNWSPDGRFLTVEYETPALPPDIYRVDVDGGEMTQLTFSNPPALAAKPMVIPEPVRYASYDGLEIEALLWKPHRPNGAAVLRPHGGPTDQYKFHWDILAQYLLAKGYTFFTPNFRGSTGYGVAFEHGNYDDWGVGDTQDCLYGARYLRDLDWIDPARIAIFGSSYGGYMVACCLALDPDYLFACGVSKYGDANLFSSWAQCERHTRLYTEMQIGHPATNRQVYAAGSPITHIANVQKPTLLLHGLEDDIVPPQSSEEWVEALRRHDKVFEYKTYANEPHGFLKRETELDWMGRLERFLDWYLMPPVMADG